MVLNKATLDAIEPAFREKLIQLFIEETQKGLLLIKKGFDENDFDAVKFQIHKHKASCQIIGADKLHTLFLDFEANATSSDLNSVGLTHDDLFNAFVEFREAYHKVYDAD